MPNVELTEQEIAHLISLANSVSVQGLDSMQTILGIVRKLQGTQNTNGAGELKREGVEA
jgi:hypothetical protein